MEKDYTRYEGCASAVAVILALVVLAVVLCGCKTKYITETEYKEVPVVMHDTVQSHDTLKTIAWRIDTTIVKDSVYFAIKGDTIFKERYSTKWRIKMVHDTIFTASDKRAHEENPVETKHHTDKSDIKEVNRIYWWQKVLMLIGGASLIYFLALLHNSRKRN
ncbi:MAG: hypothetical protein SPG73_03900 [Sodaliphilus sp.]|nr:hypothetical protein [Sodaliphilus sp.]